MTLTTTHNQFAIPFLGLVNTIHEDNLNRWYEYDIEEMTQEEASEYHDKINWKATSQEYARCYCNAFESILNTDYSLPNASVQFVELVQPREYNFETDRIFAILDETTIQTALQNASNNLFKNHNGLSFESFLDEEMKPRSGFIPFFSNSIDDWFERDLEPAQVSLILEWLFDESQIEFDYQGLHEVQPILFTEA